MTRDKVKLTFIANDSARKATFKKRKRGLMKKVSELSTLCGIDACAIIFSPYDTQPEIWPSQQGVQRVLSQFKKMPEMEQSKKMVDQCSFLKQRINKANEQLKKQMKDNREKEITEVMFQGLTDKAFLKNLNMMELDHLGRLIDQNLKEICRRMETLNKAVTSTTGTAYNNALVADHPSASSSSSQAAAATMAISGSGEIMVQQIMDKGGSSSGPDRMMNSNLVNAMQQQQQQQQWFLELMDQPKVRMGFGGDEMILPFGDARCSHNALWTNNFYS